MSAFITDQFLLSNKTAISLYEGYAKGQPIIDYHSHLPVRQIAENMQFTNMTHIWLHNDHYKWRQMRSNGIDERYCTGDAGDWEKFEAWAGTMPKLIGNPLYHWTHMELKDPFGITDRLLDRDSAKSIWEECNEKLKLQEYNCRGLMNHFNVKVACTTDDPADTLEWHRTIAADKGFVIKVLPTFRPDRAMAVEAVEAFNAWVDRLEKITGAQAHTFDAFIAILRKRHADFHDVGCRISDHGLETAYAEPFLESEIKNIYARLRNGEGIDKNEILQFKSAMMAEFGRMDHEKGWTMQLHLGALRNNNSRLLHRLGPDAGCDSIGDFEIARPLSRFLDSLDKTGQLPKTILYNVNPRDNELIASMIGNFQDGSVPGKMQYGAAWWFLDQMNGMERHLDTLSNLGLLSRFTGMLTDSRSFLSFPRHDYFRRILCNRLGTWMEQGLIPGDISLIGGMVTDICWLNARDYFGFNIE